MSDNSMQSVVVTPPKPRPKRVQKTKAKVSRVRQIDTHKTDRFGFRVGTLKARAAALYATKKGATLNEIKSALKSTQFNVLTELEHKGYKVERIPVGGMNDRKVTRYHVITK